MEFNLADLFEKVADNISDRDALVCGAARATYGQLDARANQLAHYLSSQGIGSGDKVGLYLYNCNEYLEGMLACFKIRAIPVNVNYRYVEEELLYIFRNADMRACIHNQEFTPHIEKINASAGEISTFVAVSDESNCELATIGAIEYETAIAEHSEQRNFESRSADDLFMLYTGGTTGMPKGVMWPHKALFFAAMGGGGWFSPLGPCVEPDDILSRMPDHAIVGMALAPLMHGACWWYACIQLLAGGVVVLNEQRSLNADHVWDVVEREKVNSISVVGDAMAIPLLDSLDRNPGRWDHGSVI